MKTVILAGGLGTRLSEETVSKPKPMVEIGGYPILWHIMNIYSHYNMNEFTIALGYKGYLIKDYFINYYNRQNDISINLKDGNITQLKTIEQKWKVDLIDTGKDTLTGGRLKRLEPHLKDSGTFMMTYGDGLSNINIQDLLKFHKSHQKIATISCVRPPARFGTMTFEDQRVTSFKEKPQTGEGWINGGFFVFEPEIFDYIEGDHSILEKAPLENLAKNNELMAYQHQGFWHCMDTLRDKNELNKLWETNPPWKAKTPLATSL